MAMMAKHSLRSTVVTVLFFWPVIVVIGVAIAFQDIEVARDVALTTYSSQIQLFAIFAALAPVVFAFIRPSMAIRAFPKPNKAVTRYAVTFMILQLLSSFVGITMSFASMISERFDGLNVILPFAVAAFAATMLVASILRMVGALEPIMRWEEGELRGLI
jgi:hypothetical protein